jgi:2-polyprenyl-3-methyl-5-hydroxy-6-metoxy-1,4-benzoquinol methylase
MTFTGLHKLDNLDPRVPCWNPFPLERRGCPFCKEYSVPLFLRPDNLPVSQCGQCRCFYVSLRVSDEVLTKFYDCYWSETCPRSLTDEMARYLVSSARNRACLDMCMRKLTALLGSWEGTRALDLGCGFGEKATMMKDLGASVTGLDISAAAVKFTTAQLGIETYCSTIEEWAGKNSFFDIVTMFEFIEHLLDPLGSLMAAVNKMRTGGLLAIVTPNGTAGDRGTFPFRDEWIGFRVDLEHMQYLHVDTIDYLAHKLDCRILHCEQVGFRALDDIAQSGRETTLISSQRLKRFIKDIPGVRSAVYAFRNLQMKRRAAARPPLDTGVYHLFTVLQKTGVWKGNDS